MKQEITKDVTVTTRGQLTLPAAIRRALKLGGKRKVRVTMAEGGALTIRALPDVMAFFGTLHNAPPYDPREKHKARDAMGRRGMDRDGT